MAKAYNKIIWDDNPIEVLKTLRDSHKNAILRPVLRRVGRQIRADVKTAAPKDTGALKSSIRTKVKTRRDGKGVYLIVGPDYWYTRPVKRRVGGKRVIQRRQSGRNKGSAYVKRPGKYLHLVERDRKTRESEGVSLARKMGRSIRRFLGVARTVPGRPFLEPTLRRNWGTYQQIIYVSAQMQYDKWLAKRLKAGKNA